MNSSTTTTATTTTMAAIPDDELIRESIDIGSYGVEYARSVAPLSRLPSNTLSSIHDFDATPSGMATPDPLLGRAMLSRVPTRSDGTRNHQIELDELRRTTGDGHIGDAFENLSRALSNHDRDDHGLELKPTISHRLHRRLTPVPSDGQRPAFDCGPEGGRSTAPRQSQGVPQELGSLTAEIIFVIVCSAGQLLFSFFLGDINVCQTALKQLLGLQQGELPWLVGSFLAALGLSVVLAGSLTDLAPPKLLMVGAFCWLTIWNIITIFTLTPSRAVVFFITRAMNGLAVGVLVSGSMSILGRVYNPGLRKTRVFSAMAAAAPFGFWLGNLQGGALSSRIEWVFGSNAIICGLCAIASWATIPALRPAADCAGADAPSLRSFDFKGAICAVVGCVCLLFGLTQGSVAHWSPYTYTLIILGVLILGLFFWLETKVVRPLIPAKLWRTPGFAPLIAGYFLGFGAFNGAWQFYAVQFYLTQQRVSPLTVALYLTPNAIAGVIATWLVSRLMNRIPGHWIFFVAQVAFALGPAFFLPQTAKTNYWSLGMPGIALATFGPDLSFAAASIFITSNVPRSYQGSAGSLLVTAQNLSSAIMTSVADSIAARVSRAGEGEPIDLHGLKAAWWFGLGSAALGAVITAVWVRIPKEEEKEHVA